MQTGYFWKAAFEQSQQCVNELSFGVLTSCRLIIVYQIHQGYLHHGEPSLRVLGAHAVAQVQ